MQGNCETFHAVMDYRFVFLSVSVGSGFLAAGLALAYAEWEMLQDSFRVQWLGLVIVLLAVVFLVLAYNMFRFYGAPVGLDVYRVNTGAAGAGGWVLTLRRRLQSSERRSLQDLNLYLETFSMFPLMETNASKCIFSCPPLFKASRAGFTTAKSGCVHLYFGSHPESDEPEIQFSISLQDPRAFFIKLHEMMAEISHPLASTTAEYVAGWDHNVPC